MSQALAPSALAPSSPVDAVTTPPHSSSARPGRAAYWAGWLLGGLPAAALLMGGVTDLLKLDFVVEGITAAGYPESMLIPLGVVIVLSAVLYFVPRTSVLGAILLTAYMGGAVNHHVHRSEFGQIVPGIVFAALLWLGLLLRDLNVRRALSLRNR
ncbi:DoxX family protein [Alienimonas californiensis]|uniref:DoxX-like family protein n=1 Tax=Alienimonas californiensis TaxID=2527989 RepID=A0A517P623_9PLAN|nr:DoxX family protein [Alienimonas californiensis]QDT14812.1 hypothetical protein CA12_08920 [Alienimonas californiensis]